jgi:hypothetical protein
MNHPPTTPRRASLLIFPLLIGLCACVNVQVVQRRAPQQRVIARTYPLELLTLRKAILDNFNQAPAGAALPFWGMRAIELKAPSYPPDWLANRSDLGNFLDVYKAIPASLRGEDLLLEEPTGDRYWISE